jgi:hypothetical protein
MRQREWPVDLVSSDASRAPFGTLTQRLAHVANLQIEGVFIPSHARGADTPRCAKRRSPLRSSSRKRHAICSRRGGRLVQWTAGRRRSRRDSRLIVKTSPRFTVNWPALASSILEDSGPVFTNRRCGAISPVRSVPDPPASTAPRAREGIKTHALLSRRRSSTIHGAHPIPKLR